MTAMVNMDFPFLMKKPPLRGGGWWRYSVAMLNYTMRAFRRLATRGPLDTALYSYSVARNAALSAYVDLRYAKKLARTRITNDSNKEHHAIQHSAWHFLDSIFQQVTILPDDVLVDVGCGDGRVIAYWLSLGLRNKMVGIEIDRAAALDTQRRFKDRANVTIINDSAEKCADQCGGALFYLFNPFSGETLTSFEQVVRTINPRIVFYCYNDLSAFSDWKIEKYNQDQDQQWRFAVLTRP